MTHFGPSTQTQISNKKEKKKKKKKKEQNAHTQLGQINKSSQSTTLYTFGALTYMYIRL